MSTTEHPTGLLAPDNMRPDLVPLSKQWFAARKSKFTASVVASLANLDGYESQKAAYEILIGLRKKKFSPWVQVHLDRGQRAETAIVRHFASVTSLPVTTAVAVYERDNFLATPDALLFDPERGHYAVEVKCCRSLGEPHWESLPLKYAVQLHVQMFCMNLLRGVLVASDGINMRVFWVSFSSHLWDMIHSEISAVEAHRAAGHPTYPVAQKKRRIEEAKYYVEAAAVRQDYPASEEIARKCGYSVLVEWAAHGGRRAGRLHSDG